MKDIDKLKQQVETQTKALIVMDKVIQADRDETALRFEKVYEQMKAILDITKLLNKTT